MSRYIIGLKNFSRLRSNLNLLKDQEAVLIGSILGDGYLQKSKDARTARLQIRHSTKYQDYVRWKYNYFLDWSPRGLIQDKANNSVYFYTLFHPELLLWQNKFYLENKKKIIPSDIAKILINPLSLAIWFMDDGNGYLKTKALRISSYSFTGIDNQKLIDCLLRNFNIESSLLRDKKGYQIYIKAKSAPDFFQSIKPYLHYSMMYKFSRLNPVETTRQLPDESGMKI